MSAYASANVLLAGRADGAVGVCRLNAKDTLLFTTIDCYIQPDTMIDAPITISRFTFLPHYLEHPFVFMDTLFPPFQPVPFTTLPVCDFSTAVEGVPASVAAVFSNPSKGHVTVAHTSPIMELVIMDAL